MISKLSIILCLSFIILAIATLTNPKHILPSNNNVCQTSKCFKSAAKILENMDETVDPCTDFYQFSCGGYLKKQIIPDDRTEISTTLEIQNELDNQIQALMEEPYKDSDSKVTKMMKDAYNSCLDVDAIEAVGNEPLNKVLDLLGGWPVVVGEKWDAESFDWLETLLELRKLGYSHQLLFGVAVTEDMKNNTRYVIFIDEHDLDLSDRSFYIEGFNNSNTKALFNFMVHAANLLGTDEKSSVKELMDAFNFETTLAKYTLPKEETGDINAFYNEYTVKDLYNLAPKMDWLKLLNGLLNDPISNNDRVIVANPDFIKKVAHLIENTNKRTIANYIIGKVVKASTLMLSKEWSKLLQEYVTEITGDNKEESRSELCNGILTKNLPIGISASYVKKYFDEDSKEKADELVYYLLKEFRSMLENADWMEENTKKEAIAKADAITPFIGFPKQILNDTLLTEYYGTLTINPHSAFNNLLSLLKFKTDDMMSKLRKTQIKTAWLSHANVAEVNAHYIPSENSIDFPAGILQKDYFDKDRPNYLNFGAIGFVIGHEITHGFDNQGKAYDKEGNTRNWWDEITAQRFTEKAQCIIDQYANYTSEIGLKLNGFKTQDENIADNGGLKESFEAYRSWVKDNGPEPLLPGLKYTPEQLFWIMAGNVWCSKFTPTQLAENIMTDEHSPAPFRIIGTMSNLPQFSKEFHCPLGSPMNPEHKCKVW